MTRFELLVDEEHLGKGEASMMIGPLSVIGDLTLTSHRIHFEPNRLNKLVGVKPLTLTISSIKAVSIVGIDQVITIQSTEKKLKFMGKWAKAVHDRLQGRLHGIEDLDQTFDGFALDERYILQASLDYSASSVVMVGGDLTVTARHVRFTPSALEQLMWRDLKIELAIEAIEDLELTGPRRLTFRVGEDSHRFAGVAATRAYAAIWAAQQHIASELPNRDFVFEIAVASFQRGVLAHPGILVQTRDGLTFFVGGSLDTLVGVPPISHYLWADIRQLDLSQAGKLGIDSRSHRVVFSIPNLANLEFAYLRGFSRIEGRNGRVLGLSDDPVLRREDQEDAANIVDELSATWGARLPTLTGQTLALWGPALRVSHKVGCRRGHIAVFDEYVLWIPAGGTVLGVNPLVLPIAKLQRVGIGDKTGPDLRLHLGGNELRLLPATEQRFTQPFWQLVGDRAAEITVNQADSQEAPSQSPDVWNRRITYRVGLPVRHHIPLELRLIAGEESTVTPGRLTNLSLGGIGFASAITLQVGTTVLVSMPQGESRNTNFSARVIYSRRVGRRKLIFSGLEFTTLSSFEHDELRRLWTACQRIEVQIQRGMDERDILPLAKILNENPVNQGDPDG